MRNNVARDVKITKKDYEEYLNENIDPEYYLDEGTRVKNYGSWLRKNDKIAFNVGYNEFVEENSRAAMEAANDW